MDVVNIMIYEMDELTERCGKVESNFRKAHQDWQAKWTKLYDYKYIEVVKKYRKRKARKEEIGFAALLKEEKI